MKKYLPIIALGLILVIFGVYFNLSRPNVVTGSVIPTGECYATSTRQAITGSQLTSGTLLKTGQGTICSVNVFGATSVGRINLYDATTTDATKRTNVATTTIVAIPSTTLANTYTIDAAFNYGLIVDLDSTTGTSTITYR